MKKALLSFTVVLLFLFSFTLPKTIMVVHADSTDNYLSEQDYSYGTYGMELSFTIPANSGYFEFYISMDQNWVDFFNNSDSTDDFWVYIGSNEFEGSPYDFVNGGAETFGFSGEQGSYSYTIPNSTTTTSISVTVYDSSNEFFATSLGQVDSVFALFSVETPDEVEPEFTYSNLLIETPYYDLITEADIRAQLSATDDEDGDVTSRIEVYNDIYTSIDKTLSWMDYFIMYRVSDLSGNYAYLRVDIDIIDDIKPQAIYNGTTYNDGDSLSFTWYNDSPDSVKLDSWEIQEMFEYLDAYDITDDLMIEVVSNYYGEEEYQNVVGTHVVTVGIEDSSGNHTDITINVSVLSNSAPVITGASTKAVEITTLNIGSILASYSATDTEDGTLTVTVDPSNTWDYSTPTLGSYTLLLRATDSLGRVTTKSVAITVADTIAPVIKVGGIASTTYSHTVYMSNTATLQTLINSITAEDTFYGNLTTSLVIPTLPSFSTPGTTPLSITCTDASGNTGTLVLTVIVADDIVPVINGAIKIVKGKTASLTLSEITAELSAVDNISGVLAVELVSDGYTGNATITGSYLVRYKATDTAGNIGYHDVRIWVVDNIAPVWIVDDFFINLGLNESMNRTELVGLLQASGMIANDVSYTVTFLSDDYTGSEELSGVYSVVMRVTYDDGSEDEITVQLSVPEVPGDGDIIVGNPEDELTGLQKAWQWTKTAAVNTWNFIKNAFNTVKSGFVWVFDHILKPVWNFIFVKDTPVIPDTIPDTTVTTNTTTASILFGLFQQLKV